MKKLLLVLGIAIFSFACDQDRITIDDLNASNQSKIENSTFVGQITSEKFKVIDADRCDNNIDKANFWWPDVDPTLNFEQSFFESTEDDMLTLIIYSDGTANITGTTTAVEGQNCMVAVDVWLENRKSWTEWQEDGGEFKIQGCSEVVPETQDYYIINSNRSSITSIGSDCLGEGTYGLEQRPDPNDSETPNFGVVVGPGGALWDSNVGEDGLAGWAWITDKESGERLWISDFNFLIGEKIEVVQECLTSNANRCDQNVTQANFWWPGEDPTLNFEESFLASPEDLPLTYTEFEDGTVNIRGTTMGMLGSNCEVSVNLWLKEKRTWTEWQAMGGEFKEGDGCSNAIPEEQIYYIIDGGKSCITSIGSDCLGEGTYGLEQRPDPNDPNTPSFGVVVGPGGALWDSNEGANGLAGWAWITDKSTGERLWISDFNFLIECSEILEE